MKKTHAKKWANALRSGKYKQGKRQLKSFDYYCCLGVLDELFPEKNLSGGSCVTLHYYNKIGLESAYGRIEELETSLSTLNDEGYYDIEPLNFDEIADIIEIVYVHGMD